MKPKHKAAKSGILPSLREVAPGRTPRGTRFGTCGTGTSLVLIPGFGADHTAWAPVVPVLRHHFHVILIDPPGMGESAPIDPAAGFGQLSDAVAEVLDHLAEERAALLGASMGGMVAMDFAARQPHRVNALCVVGTMARVEPHARRLVEERVAILEAEGPEAFATRILLDLIPVSYRRRHPKVVDAVMHAYALALPPAASVRASARLLLEADLTRHVARIDAPTLIVHGAEDAFVTGEAVRALARAIAGATLRELPGIGHHVLLEARDAILPEIVAFLSHGGR